MDRAIDAITSDRPLPPEARFGKISSSGNLFIDLTSELIGMADFKKLEGPRRLSKAGGGKGGGSSSKGSSKAGGFSKGGGSAASVAIGTVRGPNGEE